MNSTIWLALALVLVLPFNDLDRVEFTINLMRYYIAADSEEENKAFKKMISTLPICPIIFYVVLAVDLWLRALWSTTC